MADVKCPMCGKPNPAVAEVCEYCQARLKPLIIGNSGGSDPADLLAGLRLAGETNPAESVTPEPEASEVDSTDWLARIRARHQSETPAPTGETPTEGEESVSDWLAGLRQEPEEPTSDDDALSRLFGEATPSGLGAEPVTPLPEFIPGESEPTRETPQAGSEDDLSWLNAFQTSGFTGSEKASVESTAEIPSEPIEAEAEPAADLSWLADFGIKEQPVPEAESDDDMGWLSAFQAGGITGSDVPPIEPIAEIPAEPVESASEPTSILEFGTDLSGGEQPTSEARSDDDLDWLNAFQSEQPATPIETAAEPAIESPTEPVADFGWLADLNAAGTQAESTAVYPGSAPLDEESTEILQPATDALPDWLVKLQGTPAAEVPSEPIQAAQPEQPGWLVQLQGTPAAKEPSEPVQAEQPDWLVKLQGTQAAQVPSEPIPAAQPEQPDWLRSLSGESDQPEIPSGPFTIPVVEEPSIPVPDSNALSVPGQDIPDWLTSLPSEYPTNLPMAPAFLPEDQLSPPAPVSTSALFSGQDIPEWIGQEVSVEKPVESEEAPTEELERAQLPTWLQTMRPVEAVAPITPASDVDDNRVEKVGPLAGLRGLVNGSETVTQYRKPPVYSIKLQVTERQRLHATLLENILNTENQATTPAKEALLSSQRILRALVTLMLLAALLVPLILDWSSTIPSRHANQLEVFVKSMGEINRGDPILLAVEYDPGLAAELEEAAAGPLQWLSQKNAVITLISTSPTGPALGEALISQAPGWKEKYQNSSANLGYIAGGSTAVAQLASSSLTGHVLLNNLTRSPIRLPKDWSIQQNLSDYKVIILLTDNVEIGRAWVEQISPALGETPLLIISSAQSAPVLQAYTGAQVQSLISGSTQASSRRTAAFQIGMLLAALLILIGGVVQGIALLLSRSKKPREE